MRSPFSRHPLTKCGLILTTLSLAHCATAADPRDRANPNTASTDPPTAEQKKALSVEPATGPAAPVQNPFAGASFFVNPDYVAHVVELARQDRQRAPLEKSANTFATGLWLDRIAALDKLPRWLSAARAEQDKTGKPVVPVVVVYNLPNRDCAAHASAGELVAAEDGEARYRRDFIDEIAREFARSPEQRVVVILEPDSLANMATNMSIPQCSASAELYKRSVAYAVATLSLPNVYLYLDAAHAGWLGWDNNRKTISAIFDEVLDMAGGHERIRGFATNVSNYNALDGQWGWKLESSNPCPNEYCYVEKLSESLAEVGITSKGFIIDTSRSGVPEARTRWGHWCNVAAAGLGERPQVAPRPLLDAYFWVKPPGESDGVADPTAARYDAACSSQDSASGAPQAGHWFPSYFLSLADKANPPL